MKANTIIVGDLNVKQLCQRNKYKKELHTSLITPDMYRGLLDF